MEAPLFCYFLHPRQDMELSRQIATVLSVQEVKCTQVHILFLAEGIIIEMFLSYTIHKNRGVSFGLTN